MELSEGFIRRNILERYEVNSAARGRPYASDYATEYGEPGYSFPSNATTPMILLGSWWCRCGDERFKDLHSIDHHHPRVWAQLEDQGVQLEWEDEWMVDYEGSSKAYRTRPDSYGWTSSILWDGECGYVTPDDGVEAWIDVVKDDSSHALTYWGAGDLIGAGFEQWAPDDPQQFETGWHPGQDDDPKKVLETIRETVGDEDTVTVVFLIDSVGQFDARWSAYVRKVEDDD